MISRRERGIERGLCRGVCNSMGSCRGAARLKTAARVAFVCVVLDLGFLSTQSPLAAVQGGSRVKLSAISVTLKRDEAVRHDYMSDWEGGGRLPLRAREHMWVTSRVCGVDLRTVSEERAGCI